MSRFYPLRRRHHISPPRMTPVTRVFEFYEGHCELGMPDGLRDMLMNFGLTKTEAVKWNPHTAMRAAMASLERLPPGTWKIARHQEVFDVRIVVTITTPARMGEKLRRYFES